MIKQLHMYVLAVILSVNGVYSQLEYGTSPTVCCNSQPCPQVENSPVNIEEVVSESPLYELVSTASFYSSVLDNLCHTYYPLDNGTYVRFSSLTYYNNTVQIQKYIVAPLPEYPGVFRHQGLLLDKGSSTIVYDEVYLGSACPGVRVYYRNYIAGSCNALSQILSDPSDSRHGDSSTPYISDCCTSQVSVIGNSQCFRGSDFVTYSNRLNKHCVTQWNGVSCINAYKVSPQDSVSLPDTGSSCLIYSN